MAGWAGYGDRVAAQLNWLAEVVTREIRPDVLAERDITRLKWTAVVMAVAVAALGVLRVSQGF
jgi:hypothetical protein